MKYTHLSPVQLSSLLTNKTVRYENTKKESSVTGDRKRTFKIGTTTLGSLRKWAGYSRGGQVQDLRDGGRVRSK